MATHEPVWVAAKSLQQIGSCFRNHQCSTKSMTNFELNNYKAAGATLQECLKSWRPALSGSAIDHVLHFLDHGEYELAYESLILAVIEEKVSCPVDIADRLHKLGQDLAMATESVFAAGFWARAEQYLKGEK